MLLVVTRLVFVKRNKTKREQTAAAFSAEALATSEVDAHIEHNRAFMDLTDIENTDFRVSCVSGYVCLFSGSGF